MSIRPCSACGKRVHGKLATSYNAWFLADESRVCWRQQLCVPCLTGNLGSLLAKVSEESLDVTVCPACGAESSEDLDPIYLTIFLPKQEPREYALTTCGSCAATLRGSLQEGAKRMADRGAESGGSGTPHSDPWAGVLP